MPRPRPLIAVLLTFVTLGAVTVTIALATGAGQPTPTSGPDVSSPEPVVVDDNVVEDDIDVPEPGTCTSSTPLGTGPFVDMQHASEADADGMLSVSGCAKLPDETLILTIDGQESQLLVECEDPELEGCPGRSLVFFPADATDVSLGWYDTDGEFQTGVQPISS